MHAILLSAAWERIVTLPIPLRKQSLSRIVLARAVLALPDFRFVE